MKSKAISFPYVGWMAVFVVAPLIMVVVYAFTTRDWTFTGANFAEMGGYIAVIKPEVLEDLTAGGVREVILATNPIFPKAATENRIRWAGLEPEDFLLYTTYENSRYCKPNPKYFEEILRETGRRPEECVMVGNDASEDTTAGALGIPVFLLTDCLINRQGADLSAYPQGGFPELKEYLARL